ncbi:F-box protein At2g39490 [Ziziphus jujuba]|uniref:F-box protein At2g39490 n=1 Tax=Ziziphus jujuba TaxID=326968 RepID=A0A6P3ZDI8_ZIZJJ|nr:F-box protein At2g39490 [Ziziphus jujuba]
MEENTDNLFRKLPDELLCRIISFLPSETALETSLVSTRWRGLWNLVSVKQGNLDGIACSIAEFLTHFDRLDPLKQPRKLQFHLGKDSTVLATIAANDKLQVDFSTVKQEFPKQFDWKLVLINHHDVTHQPCPSNFFVKTLNLKSVGHLTNEAVSSMMSKFQFLESLKIIECNGLQTLCVESTPKLQNLTIFDCPDLISLRIRSSKLRSFRFRGKLPRITPEYHFNLVDAMLDCRQGPGYGGFKSSDFDPALLTIKNAEVLTLCRWTFEALIWPGISPLKGNFQFYKLKELWWIDSSKDGYCADALIYFLKLCPALERLFVTIDEKSYCIPIMATCTKEVDRHTKLGHVKVVKLDGFTKQEDEISLLKHIRELVKVDPLTITSSNENCFRSSVKESPYQPKFCSNFLMEAPWSEGRKNSDHFEEVNDINNLCPKHAQMGLMAPKFGQI